MRALPRAKLHKPRLRSCKLNYRTTRRVTQRRCPHRTQTSQTIRTGRGFLHDRIMPIDRSIDRSRNVTSMAHSRHVIVIADQRTIQRALVFSAGDSFAQTETFTTIDAIRIRTDRKLKATSSHLILRHGTLVYIHNDTHARARTH